MNFPRRIVQRLPQSFFLQVALGCVLGGMCLMGVMVCPDSEGYIHASFYRSALYPLIIQSFLFVSDTHGLLLLVVFQFVLGFVAIRTTLQTLQNLFGFQSYLLWFLLPIFLIPYIGGKLGNTIFTEAIAFPLFLLGMRSLLKAIRYKQEKDFLVFLVYLTLLVLTRRQFLFLYAFFPVVIIWLYWMKVHIRKSVLIAACILSFVASSTIEGTYHLVVHNRFETSSEGGRSLLIAPLYLSTLQDSTLFDDALQRSLFVKIRREMIAHALVPDETELFHPDVFALNYDKILHEHLLPMLESEQIVDPSVRDHLLSSIALPLMKHNWQRQLHLYCLDVIYYFGGYYYFAVVGIFFLFALFVSVSRHSSFFSVASFFILLMAGANVAATCVFIAYYKRYSIYTDAFVIALIIIAIDRSLLSWNKNISIEPPESGRTLSA